MVQGGHCVSTFTSNVEMNKFEYWVPLLLQPIPLNTFGPICILVLFLQKLVNVFPYYGIILEPPLTIYRKTNGPGHKLLCDMQSQATKLCNLAIKILCNHPYYLRVWSLKPKEKVSYLALTNQSRHSVWDSRTLGHSGSKWLIFPLFLISTT